MAVAAVLLLGLLVPLAEAAPTSFTINVVSARSLGCSPDFFTSPDLRVRVLVDGAPVHVTKEASDQKEPTFAVAIPASATFPVQIGVESEEGEPSGFFGTQTTYESCSMAPGGVRRAVFTYNGEDNKMFLARGDGSNAAEVVLVVGTTAPAAPVVSAAANAHEVALTWDADTSGQATSHTVAAGGAGRLLAEPVGGTVATVAGLCDNNEYAFRVIRNTASWRITSADVAIRTTNVAPEPPIVLSANSSGNVSFDSPTFHDAARFDIHAGPRGFTPADASIRKSLTSPFFPGTFSATGLQFAASDAEVIVRLTDTGGLSADSARFALGAPERQGSRTFGEDCSPGATTGAPADAPASPSPTPAPTSAPIATSPSQPTAATPTATPEAAVSAELRVRLDLAPDAQGELRARTGTTLGAILDNPGPDAVDVSVDLVDRTGKFDISMRTRAQYTVPAASTLRIRVPLEAPLDAIAPVEVDAALTVEIAGGAARHEAPFVLEIIPHGGTWLGGDVFITLPAGEIVVAPGERAAVRLHATNQGPRQVALDVRALAALVGGQVGASVSLGATPDNLVLAPGSSSVVEITISVGVDATAGALLSPQIAIRASDAVQVDEQPVAFSIRVAAAPVAAGAGAGLVVAGLAAVAVGGGALLLWLRRDSARFALAVAMYSRLSRSQLADHPAREELRARIDAAPGVCYSELKRATGMNTGALVHHLRAMERAGMVASRKEGAFRRFYLAGGAAVEHLVIGAASSLTPMQVRVLDALRDGPLTQGELAARLGLSQQGTSHHVKALERAGHLVAQHDGSAWRYAPMQDARVRP